MQRLGRPAAATCVAAAHQQMEWIRAASPHDCQFLSLRDLASPAQPQDSASASGSVAVLPPAQALLRHMVWSHAEDGSSFVIAYAMKRSRGLSLAERGFFPLVPTDGLCFLPLDLDQDIGEQGPFTAILHKVFTLHSMPVASSPIPGITTCACQKPASQVGSGLKERWWICAGVRHAGG